MKSNDEIECRIINVKLGIFPQYIIYHFNELPVRNQIINDALKKYEKTNKFTNFGTINIRKENGEMILTEDYDVDSWKKIDVQYKPKQNFNDFIEKNKKVFEKKTKTIFTVCYHYNQANVHFVSFIYDKNRRELISFDPGVDVYPEGQDEIVPALIKAFKKAKLMKETVELGKTCYKHRYIFKNEPVGIQYNNQTKDAFCQTWTLFFLVHQIQQHKIVRKICKIHPANREIFLFQDFIIPILKEKSKYVQQICRNIFYSTFEIFDEKVVLNDLISYSKLCKTKICNKKKLGNHKKQENRTCEQNLIK